MEKNWFNILGVQLCFLRFPIDSFSGKWWSKEIDHRRHAINLGICQHNPIETLVDLCPYHKIILD